MRNAAKGASSLIFLLLLVSCVGNGPLFVQESIAPNENPCLYIYRPVSTYLKAAAWEFLVDKNKVITLKDGTYAKIPITEGRHEIVSGMSRKIGQPPLHIFVEATKGKNLYVKYEIQMQGSLLRNLIDKPKFDNHLSEVEESQALSDLKELHLTMVTEKSR